MTESFQFLKPSSRIICLPCNVCANFISLVSFLWHFFTFSKAITSFCCFGAGEHLGHPCRWQPRNWNNLFVSWLKPSTACPAIFFPRCGHMFDDEYAHQAVEPSNQQTAFPAYATCPWKLFICSFGQLDLLSLAHLLCGSSHVNLWMSLQMARFCESCFTFYTCIIFCNSIEICDQESVLFIDPNVQLGHPNFVKAWRKIFQHKDSFGVNLTPRKPLLEMTFYKRTVPFVDSTLNWMLVEKACSYLTSSFCVENTMPPWGLQCI